MKTITWDTNFNNKMHCLRFPHIDLAPQKMPTSKELEQATFLIQTSDKSHQPVEVTIESIIPLRLAELSNIHTWPSHGMDTTDFINWQHLKTPIHKDTPLAIYYYKRLAVN